MKRTLRIVFCLLMCTLVVLCFSACGVSDEEQTTEPEPIETEDVQESEEPVEIPEAETETETETETDPEIDIDLTQMSSTMIYSEVYNMMMTPDEYIDKVIKIEGDFVLLYSEEEEKYFFGCLVQDATACCSQGIEFELTDDYKYPEDYPEEGEKITVVGTFDTYMEGEYMYCTLRNAKLV